MTSDQQLLNDTLDSTHLTKAHWRIWFLSSMGIFMEGFNLFVIGVALPLITHQFELQPALQGAVGAAAIGGTVCGSMLIGHLADTFGRKPFYVFNLVMVVCFAIASGLARNIPLLIVFQFLLGMGVGADYPVCASYISEFMPSRIRGRMLLATFSFQALGMMVAAATGMAILTIKPIDSAWHLMLMLGAVPAVIILFFRMYIPESPRWCLEHGHRKRAAKILKKFLPHKKKEIARFLKIEQKHITHAKQEAKGYRELFRKKYLRRTILACAPWFFMDIATYGVGIFTPTILASLALTKSTSFIGQDFAATQGAAFLDLFLIVGFVFNLFLVDRIGRIRLQVTGFIGMTIGLLLLAFGALSHDTTTTHTVLSAHAWFDPGSHGLLFIFGGFILYNLLMNAGPNATTFILAAELFPTQLRATGHGFSAAIAKVGAVLGIFVLPLMKQHLGIPGTMLFVAAICFAGMMVTAIFRFETSGKSIDELESWEAGKALER